MNIREADSGFPIRDEVPSKILTKDIRSEAEYTARCCAFFIAIFATLTEVLKAFPDNQAITTWTDQMCDMNVPASSMSRTDFFSLVNLKYSTVRQ